MGPGATYWVRCSSSPTTFTAGAVENGADRSVFVKGPEGLAALEGADATWGGGRCMITGLGWKCGSLGGGMLVSIIGIVGPVPFIRCGCRTLKPLELPPRGNLCLGGAAIICGACGGGGWRLRSPLLAGLTRWGGGEVITLIRGTGAPGGCLTGATILAGWVPTPLKFICLNCRSRYPLSIRSDQLLTSPVLNFWPF